MGCICRPLNVKCMYLYVFSFHFIGHAYLFNFVNQASLLKNDRKYGKTGPHFTFVRFIRSVLISDHVETTFKSRSQTGRRCLRRERGLVTASAVWREPTDVTERTVRGRLLLILPRGGEVNHTYNTLHLTALFAESCLCSSVWFHDREVVIKRYYARHRVIDYSL